LEHIMRLPIVFEYNKVKTMTQKPTYEELEQRVKELEKEAVERNRAETAIREKENFLEIVFNAIQDGISVRDRDFTLTLVNQWMEKKYAFQIPLVGKKCYTAFQKRNSICPWCPAVLAMKTGEMSSEIVPYSSHDDPEGWFELTAFPVKDLNGETVGCIEHVRDITERKKTDEALKNSEEKYRELVQNANSIILRMDTRGTITFFNEFAQNFFGYSENEVLGKNVVGTIVPKTETTGRDLSEMILDIGVRPERYATNENENMRKNGERVWVAWTNKAIKDKDGNTTEILCIGNDITERKYAEKALWQEEEKFRTFVEQSPFGISIIDESGKYKYTNPKFIEIFGYTLEDIPTGKEWFKKAFPDSEYRHQIISIWITDLKKSKFGESRPRTFKVFCKDGSEKTIHFKPVTLESGNQFVIYEDITNQEQLEDQLRQAQKMESIGTLAGGIAHDFNNILGIILGNAELAMDDIYEGNPARLNLQEIRTAGLRAKDVVRQLLSFARKTAVEKKPANIAPIIIESLKLMRASIPTSIEIRQNITKEVHTILADPTQINQVLINLCTNAHHAMPDGGILEVSLKNVELDEDATAQHSDLNPGPYVHLTVADTGQGMNPEIKGRIFDPYFTTKDIGKGTGLGLSVVHGIVKNHGGAISVNSELGKGTTFEIYFPVVETEAVTETETDEKLPTGNERILFVDDEGSMVYVARNRLERLGYQVEAKTSPEEALKLFRDIPNQFDLVITDMSMPEMTGDRFVQEILKIRPDIPTILCTGYSEKIDKQKAKEMGIRQYIEKPIKRSVLAKMVRKILDEK
jgi:two-component system cell cycle sensor histidine kinase/response regulator CckA